MMMNEQDREPASLLRRLAVALDTSDWDTYCGWIDRFGPQVGVLKVGLEAYTRWGTEAVKRARVGAQDLFLDLKLHDIPNTVAGAVGAAADLGVDYLTVHAAGGPAMLESAAAAAEERITLLGVTVLTHMDEAELAAVGMTGTLSGRVGHLARVAADAGCGGVVCSPRECGSLRSAHEPPFRLVVPGVRPLLLDGGDDQRRTATPREALEAGADLLVIGRPLTRAEDPEAALSRLVDQLQSAIDGSIAGGKAG